MNSKTIKKYLSILGAQIFLVSLTLPRLVAAQGGGLVQCGRGDADQCTFADFILLINRLVKFILYYIATPLAAVLIIYAGIIMIIYASKPEGRTRAKKIIYVAIGGLVITLAAYIIVRFVVVTLTGDESLFNNTDPI